MIEVTYTNLDFPFGYGFSVQGLGELKNGEPTTIDKEQADQFSKLTGRSVREAFAHRGDFTIRTVTGGEK